LEFLLSEALEGGQSTLSGTDMRLLPLLAILVLLLGTAMAQNEAEALYKGRCARCHGEDGAGNTEAGRKLATPNLRSRDIQKMSDEELFQTIAHGREHHRYPHVFSAMGISDVQVRALVQYVRSLAPKSKGQNQP
jgi:mono/diheme cytochrome c family protein